MRSKYHWTALSALVLCSVSNTILAVRHEDYTENYQYFPKEPSSNELYSNNKVLSKSDDFGATIVGNSKFERTESKLNNLFKTNSEIISKDENAENRIDFRNIVNSFENDPSLSQVLHDDILLSVFDKNAIVKNVVRPEESIANNRSRRIKKNKRKRFVSSSSNDKSKLEDTKILSESNIKKDIPSLSNEKLDIKVDCNDPNEKESTNQAFKDLFFQYASKTNKTSSDVPDPQLAENKRQTRARFLAIPIQHDDPMSSFSTGNSFRDRLSFSDLNQNPFSSYPYSNPIHQRHHNEDSENMNFHYAEGVTPTRIVRLKQGLVQGTIIEAKMQHALPGVERYLGLPYAAAPVGGLRFMPPGELNFYIIPNKVVFSKNFDSVNFKMYDNYNG